MYLPVVGILSNMKRRNKTHMRKLLLLVCLTPLLIKLRTFHQRKEVKTILLWNPFFEDETFGLRQNIFILKLKLSV